MYILYAKNIRCTIMENSHMILIYKNQYPKIAFLLGKIIGDEAANHLTFPLYINNNVEYNSEIASHLYTHADYGFGCFILQQYRPIKIESIIISKGPLKAELTTKNKRYRLFPDQDTTLNEDNIMLFRPIEIDPKTSPFESDFYLYIDLNVNCQIMNKS